MYVRGLIPWNFAELAEAVQIANLVCSFTVWSIGTTIVLVDSLYMMYFLLI